MAVALCALRPRVKTNIDFIEQSHWNSLQLLAADFSRFQQRRTPSGCQNYFSKIDHGQLHRPHVSMGSKAVERWRRVMVNNHHARHHLTNYRSQNVSPECHPCGSRSSSAAESSVRAFVLSFTALLAQNLAVFSRHLLPHPRDSETPIGYASVLRRSN